MRYRRFGKTNLSVSVFSLGTMRYLESEENAVMTVSRAVELGINHLETARGYGDSELLLRAALSSGLPVSRDQLYITTKIPPVASGSEMDRWIDESLERLGLDYVDCLAIHGLNTQQHLEWVTKVDGCLPAVKQAVADGRVRYVGFSSHGPLAVILAAINTQLFDFVNLHYYYLFQRNLPAVELAHRLDMGVFIISPADKGGQLYTPPTLLKDLCEPFTPLELMYRFLLSDPRITTLSVGAANPKELEWPLRVADQDGPLTPAEMERFQHLEAHATQVLGTDHCHQCYACLPCPEDINIPEVLRLRNLAIAYNMNEFGKYRYQMFENAGHWFPGNQGSRCTECGDCLPRCPQNLDIPALVQDTHQRLKGKEGRRLWG